MSKFKIAVKDNFDAAHLLPGHKGKCANLHGHTWMVEIEATSTELDEKGMVLDFFDLKETLNEVISKFDHRFINEIKPFDVIPPTSENLAKYIFDELFSRIKTLSRSVALSSVTVSESRHSSATYSSDD